LTGRAVPGVIRYHYFNIQDDAYLPVLHSLGERRDRDVFCLNDAPASDLSPIDEEVVFQFLENYYPIESPYER
jgi:hypothetical protein